MVLSEIELVKRVQQGDEEAFEELYQAYYARALAIAFQMTRDNADAQDIVQETFIQVHRNIHKLNDPANFYSWLHTIIHNRCVNLFKKNENKRAVDPDKIEKYQTYEEKRRYMLPEESNNFISEQDVLKHLLADMDEKYRVVLELAYFNQLKLDEIANILDLPLGTVKTRCRRAKEDLRVRIIQFEHAENRRLAFNVDMILPSISIVSLPHLVTICKQKFTTFASSSAANVVCAVTVTTLAVSGVKMAVDDYREKQNYVPPVQDIASVPDDENTVEKPKKDEKKEDPVLMHKAFGPYDYADQTVYTTQEAYFLCINWADTLEQMQSMTPEQIEEIKPIYKGIVDANDEFYRMLVERGWVDNFNQINTTI